MHWQAVLPNRALSSGENLWRLDHRFPQIFPARNPQPGVAVLDREEIEIWGVWMVQAGRPVSHVEIVRGLL